MHSVVILFKMLSVCGPTFNSKRISDLKAEIRKNVEFLNSVSGFSSATPAMKNFNALCSGNFDQGAMEKETRLVLM